MKIENVKIIKTLLGLEDHGIFTFGIEVEGDHNLFRRIGMYALHGRGDKWCSLKLINDILVTVGVSTWEELPGKFIRIKVSDDNKVTGIGNIVSTRWLDFKEYFENEDD